jgi:hypothetical protein
MADHLVEAGGIQMGVDLGGLNASMTEQFLQHAQVGATRVHVGEEAPSPHKPSRRLAGL